MHAIGNYEVKNMNDQVNYTVNKIRVCNDKLILQVIIDVEANYRL